MTEDEMVGWNHRLNRHEFEQTFGYSEEELKSLLMKVEEESEKPGLKFNIYGEGNGNPLQYSCLENPMDGEAW